MQQVDRTVHNGARPLAGDACGGAGAGGGRRRRVQHPRPPGRAPARDRRPRHRARWRGAARAENFRQFQPQRGAIAELPTVVHVLYDDEFLYAGFQAWDPEPPLSQMIERDDPIWNDDSVQVFLDTFHDRRTGYYFMVNRLGTQTDGRIAEDGGSSDGARDAPWRSRAQRTGYGWSVEIASPWPDPVPGRRQRHLGHQRRLQPTPVARELLPGGASRLLGATVAEPDQVLRVAQGCAVRAVPPRRCGMMNREPKGIAAWLKSTVTSNPGVSGGAERPEVAAPPPGAR